MVFPPLLTLKTRVPRAMSFENHLIMDEQLKWRRTLICPSVPWHLVVFFLDFTVFQVVRCFEDQDIIHVEGSVDPVRDIDIINIELALADMAQV